jgi:dihydroflavonol-4-reductase
VRVLITGGTGYVGAFTVQALLEAGHTPRLLVRNESRLARTVGAIGVDLDQVEIAAGDMTDAIAVNEAVKGVDAVIHAAAVVAALNRADAQAALETNVRGTENVLGAALAQGCDPVIHVSSVAALFAPGAPIVTADLEPAINAESPYTKSKALSEQYARILQAAGDPVTIVYPGGVSGPAAGEVFGDVAEGFVAMLKGGVVPLKDGAIMIIDVRDLASAIVATLTSGRGPRRFVVGGTLVDMPAVGALLTEATGRRIRVLPIPGFVFRAIGRTVDVIRKVVPFDTIYTAEAMDLLTRAQATDDSAVHDQLGITYRPPIDTATAMIEALYADGRLSAKQAGKLAR